MVLRLVCFVLFFAGILADSIEMAEGSGLWEGSGATVEGSGAQAVEGSAEKPEVVEQPVTTTQETLDSQEIEILRSISLTDLATQAPLGNQVEASIDEEPLSGTVLKGMEQRIERDVHPGYSWQRLEQLLGQIVDEQLQNVSSTAKPSVRKEEKCQKFRECHQDGDCGKKGRCMGSLVGKCNCNACLQGAACTDDQQCGGLRGACREGSCGCAQVFASRGLSLYIEVLTQFCARPGCSSENDCLGLPCNSGHCDCGYATGPYTSPVELAPGSQQPLPPIDQLVNKEVAELTGSSKTDADLISKASPKTLESRDDAKDSFDDFEKQLAELKVAHGSQPEDAEASKALKTASEDPKGDEADESAQQQLLSATSPSPQAQSPLYLRGGFQTPGGGTGYVLPPTSYARPVPYRPTYYAPPQQRYPIQCPPPQTAPSYAQPQP
ncbi:unnamed protein product, partial [Mesorhabditis spiculigera]